MPASKKERQSAKERIQRTEAYADKVRQQFAGAVNDILALNKRLPELPEGQMYSFDGAGKKMRSEVDSILRELHSVTVATVRTGITQEWAEANKAVDEILASALGRRALSNPNLAGWFDRNEKAMDAFLKRTQDGFNLSRRIWNTTTQLREEMEVAMTVAIGEGESASAMSRRVRQYLDDPDLMFRRFRYKDEDGNWQRKWKKKVVDSDGHYHFVDYDRDSYNVGRGMYKSAYKNAMRVTRTETNIAYRRADHERWQQLDFVLGQRIQTSNSHPKEDICDELAGDYPKDFVFDGWHPQCFCICTPIMADEEEMKKEMEAVLAGEDYEPNYKPITTYPEGFQRFLDENREKIEQAQKAGTAPYFIENNAYVVQRRFDGENLTNTKQGQTLREKADTISLNPTQGKHLSFEELRKEYGVHCQDDKRCEREYESGMLSKFDFAGAKKDISALANLYGINIATNEVYIENSGAFRVVWGGEGFRLERYFSVNFFTDKNTVEHCYFVLDKKYQGNGLSKDIFRVLYPKYLDSGVQNISVHANIDVGGYTWARYGFNANGKSQAEYAINRSQASEEIKNQATAIVDDYYKSKSKQEPFPMHRLVEELGVNENGIKNGWELLKGTDWRGTLDLENEEQRKVFEEYIYNNRKK